MKKALLIIILSQIGMSMFGQQFTNLYGDYLGQAIPLDTPAVFALGIISTPLVEHSAPVFSIDGKEIYWSLIKRSNDSIFQNIMISRNINGQWTNPSIASFSSGKFYEGGPVISSDNKKMYIYRGRPASPNRDADSINILYYNKNGDEWTNPTIICEGFSHSVTSDGTIYFGSKLGISRKVFKNGKYSEQEILNDRINLKGYQNWTPFIAPNESYLIFSRVDFNGDYGELMISFRNVETDVWSEPINMGSLINTRAQERFPSVSIDGKYLFFTRWTKKNHHDIYWVSAKIIDELREKSKGEK